ncbi:uncharacterized protein LOC144119336 [Amblyomma americanum]
MSNNNCCVVGCSNTYKNTPETRFYSFPARPYERERRQQWIAAVRRQRKDGSLWEPTKHSRICSNHFVNGEKSNDPRSPAYLPTLFPSEYRLTKTPSAYRYERLRSRKQSKEPTSSCVQEVATDEEGYDYTNGLISVETQTPVLGPWSQICRVCSFAACKIAMLTHRLPFLARRKQRMPHGALPMASRTARVTQ